MCAKRGDHNDNYPRSTKLSCAGLVYFLHGREVLARIMKIEITHILVKSIFNKVYENFVEAIDADGNGDSICNERPA